MSSPIQPIVLSGIGNLPTPPTPTSQNSTPSALAGYNDWLAGLNNGSDVLNQLPSPGLNLTPSEVSLLGIPTQSTTTNPNQNSVLQGLFSTLNNLTGGPMPGQPTSGIGAGLFGTAPGSQAVSSGLFGNTLSGFSWGRVGGFVLGLLLIAAGLFLFGKAEIAPAVSGVVRRGVAI